MRQVHSGDFLDRVTVQTRTATDLVLGEENTWADVITLWASCCEIDYDTIGQVGVIDMDNNQSEMIFVQITLRGRRRYSQPDFRYIWKNRILQPFKTRHISRSDTQLTLVHCHDVSGLQEEND